MKMSKVVNVGALATLVHGVKLQGDAAADPALIAEVQWLHNQLEIIKKMEKTSTCHKN